MSQAEVFKEATEAAWEQYPAEHDAVVRARLQGAERAGALEHDGYREQPGDMPASTWKFPDGSAIGIGDEGWFLVGEPTAAARTVEASPSRDAPLALGGARGRREGPFTLEWRPAERVFVLCDTRTRYGQAGVPVTLTGQKIRKYNGRLARYKTDWGARCCARDILEREGKTRRAEPQPNPDSPPVARPPDAALGERNQ